MITIFAGAVAMASLAQAPAPERLISGWGHRSCRVSMTLNELHVESPQMQWVIGFISGAAVTARQLSENVGRPSRFVGNLARIDEDAMGDRLTAMVRRVCQAEPDLRLYEAADRVMGDLQRN